MMRLRPAPRPLGRPRARSAAAALAWLLALAVPLSARTPPPDPPDPAPPPAKAAPTRVNSPDYPAAVAAAVAKGLAWLAREQNADGSWSCMVGLKLNDNYEVQTGQAPQRHVGITALAGMAFLAGGSTPDRGPYGAVVRKAVLYVLSCSDPKTGYISSTGTRMYEHSFATLFLAEVAGMCPQDPKLSLAVLERLRDAAHVIIRCQNDKGGWRYQPSKKDDDISITVTTLQALRAARNVGIKVPKATIEKAVDYVRRCSTRSGAFKYQDTYDAMNRTSYALTAAGVTALMSAGDYSSAETRRGLDYLSSRQQGLDWGSFHFFYGHYYAAQALYQAGEQKWRPYRDSLMNMVIDKQADSGAWSDDVGPTYATAMACLVLQIPCDYLPIFQK